VEPEAVTRLHEAVALIDRKTARRD
jgi:hypothetical protein